MDLSETDGRGRHRFRHEGSSCRAAFSSWTQAMTFSAVWSRRPSDVIETSSLVGGSASARSAANDAIPNRWGPLRHEADKRGSCPIADPDDRLSGVVRVRDRHQLKPVDPGEVTGVHGVQG